MRTLMPTRRGGDDMSGKSIISNSYLEDIGDAIRYKKFTDEKYYPSQMADAIRSIDAPDEYSGATVVTPSHIEQVLPTTDKLVRDDIIINPAPTEYLSTDHNGTFTPSSGKVGFYQVDIDVQPDLRPLSVSENGSYQPDGFDGYSQVNVDVAPKELYPVGTDIVSVYLGRNWQNGRALLLHGTYDDRNGGFTETGNTSNWSFCPVYLPVSPEYTYYKNDNRIVCGYWYDENKNFISSFGQNNTSWMSLPAPPDNAKYLRFASNTGWSNAQIAIYRTA